MRGVVVLCPSGPLAIATGRENSDDTAGGGGR